MWRLPPKGWYKLHVHSFFFTENPLPNGDISGIGAVIRNHRGKFLRMDAHGKFLRMDAGSLGTGERRLNELYDMIEGLKRAFLEDMFDIELESDHERLIKNGGMPLVMVLSKSSVAFAMER